MGHMAPPEAGHRAARGAGPDERGADFHALVGDELTRMLLPERCFSACRS